MVHDPISALKRDTYIETESFLIPRATGIIQGKEIPTKKGYYNLLGNISITNRNLTIDLHYNNTDDKTKTPLSWNGEYELVRKE